MKRILFFDGVCNLCNGFVDFLIHRDSNLLFAPLQGKAAQQYLPKEFTQSMPSVVLWSEGNIKIKSDGALAVLGELGGVWVLMKVFWLVPKFLRDMVYDFVAHNRYRMFGKRDTCRLPTAEERERFLE